MAITFHGLPRFSSENFEDCRVKPDNDNNTTYCEKNSFRHCERSAAVHFLDCHVALLLHSNDKARRISYILYRHPKSSTSNSSETVLQRKTGDVGQQAFTFKLHLYRHQFYIQSYPINLICHPRT